MENSPKDRYYLVREDILPEALLKTVQAKELLALGIVRTVGEAVDQVELSRSAFYKYKDGIHPINELDRERIVTISFNLEHRSGILSRVLGLIAGHEANVLTIHQSIPLQGVANVVIAADISTMDVELDDLLEAAGQMDGVKNAMVIGRG